MTRTSFYVLGTGYTAWQRFDHNRIELTPERQTYKPGDTARIMIQSPWERATALVTTEREGIRSHRQFTLTSTQESISIPITEADIPNVFVSVVLVKGRNRAAAAATDVAAKPDADVSDPGQAGLPHGLRRAEGGGPHQAPVGDRRRQQQEYRPASAATVRLEVKDHQGRGTASEVTLWAVDYGVLSLTNYRTPDVLGSVYVRKALQVFNTDNRQRIISRRVLTPKGETEGGGGGADAGAGTLRKDFRVLAFWVGSVTTDANGRATVDVKLPESLTTYRIMAVAAIAAQGSDPGTPKSGPTNRSPCGPPSRASSPSVIAPTSAPSSAASCARRRRHGDDEVTGSRDPPVHRSGEQRVTVAAGGNVEVRFDAAAKAIGRARVQMTVKLGGETDAFEDVDPGRDPRVARNCRRIRRSRRSDDQRDRDTDASGRCRARLWRTHGRVRINRTGRASAKARATWSSIRTGAPSRRLRARWR